MIAPDPPTARDRMEKPDPEPAAFFVVEIPTAAGLLSERFATYEEAARRVAQFPARSLTGLPLVFKELPDGSQRLVRTDGKPLQWHRLPEDRADPAPNEPLPLSEPSPDDRITFIEPPPEEFEDLDDLPDGLA